MSQIAVSDDTEENTPRGLLTRILGSRPRYNPTLLWSSAVEYIIDELGNNRCFSVIDQRYRMTSDYDDASVEYVAGCLNIPESEVRSLEAIAIYGLQRRDRLRFFIKNFGSREMLMGLLDERTSRAEELFDSVDNTHELLHEASEVELAHFLETVEIIPRLHERYLARKREK